MSLKSLDQLDELDRKATQGEWVHIHEDNIIYTKENGCIFVAYRSVNVSETERDANAALATSLVNWYRSGGREMVRDGEKYREEHKEDHNGAVGLW